MRDEPLRRDDGKCARHGCKKPLPSLEDPFCSTECCKKHHRVTFPQDVSGLAPRKYTAEWDERRKVAA